MLIYPVLTERLTPPVTGVFLSLAPRALVTAYQYVKGEKPLKNVLWFAKNFGDRSVILDSGVYTLLKDAEQGEAITQEVCDAYFAAWVKLVQAVPSHWILVELDAHNFPGIDVRRYRDKVAKMGWQDRTVHVWHRHEGFAAVRDYAAYKRVGLPARTFEPAEGHVMLKHLVAPGRHVHLLGTTNPEYTHRYGDNVSGDASTWNRVSHYGETRNGVFGAKMKNGELRAPAWVMREVTKKMPEMLAWYRRHPEHTDKSPVRVEHVRQSACGILVFTDLHERARTRAAGHDPNAVDPLKARTHAKDQAQALKARPRRLDAQQG